MKKLTYEFIDPDKQLNSADFGFVEDFLKATGRTQIGWHYITDITWLYAKIKYWPRHYEILDVGGGSGPLQFLLAELGFNVTNVDLVFSKPPLAYTRRYRTRFEELPSFANTHYSEHIASAKSMKEWAKNSLFYRWLKSIGYGRNHDVWRKANGLSDVHPGTIRRIRGNLCAVPEIASGSFDAAVSLSALEHIPLDMLNTAVAEIKRILKSNAECAVTTSATEKNETWFHYPSQGQCFSALDIERYFGAKPDSDQEPSEILEEYQNCQYLKDNLANFYKKSGKFGMPWGIWNPKYIPLGIHS